MESHGIKEISSKVGTAFFNKVYCGSCKSRCIRRSWTGIKGTLLEVLPSGEGAGKNLQSFERERGGSSGGCGDRMEQHR